MKIQTLLSNLLKEYGVYNQYNLENNHAIEKQWTWTPSELLTKYINIFTGNFMLPVFVYNGLLSYISKYGILEIDIGRYIIRISLNISSENELEREINDKLAFKWFLD